MKRFCIYGLIGWCLEVIWTGLGSLLTGDVRLTAKTYLWMFPIYGLSLLCEPVHDRIRLWPFWGRGTLWMILFFTIEYLTGWLLRNTLGVSPWDYSNSPFHVHGLIRLDYAPVWFVAGLAYEKLHDWLELKQIH